MREHTPHIPCICIANKIDSNFILKLSWQICDWEEV